MNAPRAKLIFLISTLKCHDISSLSLYLTPSHIYLNVLVSICIDLLEMKNKSQFSMGACKMRFNWRNFLIGFSLVYALLKTLLFLYFLTQSIHDIVQDDDDELLDYIPKYIEVIFLSFLITSLILLFYGAIKVKSPLN